LTSVCRKSGVKLTNVTGLRLEFETLNANVALFVIW